MDKVIGLGKMGCSIAEELTEHPEYRIYKIGSHLRGRGDLVIDEPTDIQAGEESIDTAELAVYLRSIKPEDEVLFIVGGGEPISGLSLTVLEQIKDSRISILYVVPDRQMLSQTQKRDDKIVFNILQEYARSGLFERIYLVKKSIAEEMMGDVSIKEYEKSISHFISYLVAMVNYFNHVDPVASAPSTPPEICRISTFGITALEHNAEVNHLFPLENAQESHYYYGIPAKELEEDNSLMREIKEQTKSLASDTSISTSFSVYPTTFEDKIVLCVSHTKHVQTA
jgi:hypothetical protein|tara:strand:- start:663 stop:1511 length:849 start_codon:yes stop_codon:yes gene_type:complete